MCLITPEEKDSVRSILDGEARGLSFNEIFIRVTISQRDRLLLILMALEKENRIRRSFVRGEIRYLINDA